MGVVELSVQDIEKMTDFYSRIVGFDIVSTGANMVNLGDDTRIFLRLIEEKDFIFPKKTDA
jgi:catechol-2,3-dioxygenase